MTYKLSCTSVGFFVVEKMIAVICTETKSEDMTRTKEDIKFTEK
jgi:hypothetical protein